MVFTSPPLGSFTSRAYRLIELSFACLWCPTSADAVRCALRPPLTRGLDFAKQKTGGEKSSLFVSLPPSSPTGESTTLIRGRLDRCGGTGHSESFLEPPALPVVFLYSKGSTFSWRAALFFIPFLEFPAVPASAVPGRSRQSCHAPGIFGMQTYHTPAAAGHSQC